MADGKKAGSQKKKTAHKQREAHDLLKKFHADIEDLYKDFTSDFWGSSDTELYDSEDEWAFSPKLEVRRTPDALLITAEVPGMSENQVDIHIDGATLVIRGDKSRCKAMQTGVVLHSECRYGTFQRTVPLPARPLADAAKAVCRNGLLQINIPVKRTKRQADCIMEEADTPRMVKNNCDAGFGKF